MKPNPYEAVDPKRSGGRTIAQSAGRYLIRSGAWIGFLSVGVAVFIAVWMIQRVPLLILPPALVFVAFAACPYLIISFFSCLVSSTPAKVVLVLALMALVATTVWQFSIKDAQAAMIIAFQYPGAIVCGIIAVLINVFTDGKRGRGEFQ